MHPGIHAAANPDKPAHIMADSGVVVTYGQLEARSNQIAHLFRKLGLQAGDPIALCLENHPRYFEICWGAHRAGLRYTAINSRLTAEEISYIVGDCGAKAYITSSGQGEGPKLVDMMPGVANRYMLDGTGPGYQSWESATEGLPETPIHDECEGADMLYSSGTTGRPKGVRPIEDFQPFGTEPKLLPILAQLYGMDENTVYLSPAPLYHAAPLRFNLGIQRLGGTCIIMEHFDAENALALIERHRATHSQWVPTMFIRMLKLPAEARRRYDLSSLKVAVHAAAPCPVPTKHDMIGWWGPILHEYYAGTEGNGMTLINSQDWLAHPGSVGRAVLGQLHIMDEAGEHEMPIGEPGTIFFSDGPEFDYHNDDEKTAGSRNARGWSTLGDVGYVDDDGFLYLTDRKAYMIISGGVNIYPQEVENLLVTHDKVLDCAVFGVPNPEFGEEVKAVVQAIDPNQAGPDLEAELIGFCREHLAHYKCPKTVDFEAELPRHPTGKLYKRLLKDRYWGKTDSRIV